MLIYKVVLICFQLLLPGFVLSDHLKNPSDIISASTHLFPLAVAVCIIHEFIILTRMSYSVCFWLTVSCLVCASHHTWRPHFITCLLMVSFFSYKMWELETTHQCCRDPSYCNGVGVIKNFPLTRHSYFLNHVLHVHKCKSNCQFFTWCKSEAITCQTIMQEQLLWHHFMISENLK